eukprot:403372914
MNQEQTNIKTEEEEDDLFQSNGHGGKKKLNHQRNLIPQIPSDFAQSKRASKLNTGSIGNILEKIDSNYDRASEIGSRSPFNNQSQSRDIQSGSSHKLNSRGDDKSIDSCFVDKNAGNIYQDQPEGGIGLQMNLRKLDEEQQIPLPAQQAQIFERQRSDQEVQALRDVIPDHGACNQSSFVDEFGIQTSVVDGCDIPNSIERIQEQIIEDPAIQSGLVKNSDSQLENGAGSSSQLNGFGNSQNLNYQLDEAQVTQQSGVPNSNASSGQVDDPILSQLENLQIGNSPLSNYFVPPGSNITNDEEQEGQDSFNMRQRSASKQRNQRRSYAEMSEPEEEKESTLEVQHDVFKIEIKHEKTDKDCCFEDSKVKKYTRKISQTHNKADVVMNEQSEEEIAEKPEEDEVVEQVEDIVHEQELGVDQHSNDAIVQQQAAQTDQDSSEEINQQEEDSQESQRVMVQNQAIAQNQATTLDQAVPQVQSTTQTQVVASNTNQDQIQQQNQRNIPFSQREFPIYQMNFIQSKKRE